jgi:hypothetical protein
MRRKVLRLIGYAEDSELRRKVLELVNTFPPGPQRNPKVKVRLRRTPVKPPDEAGDELDDIIV